MKFEFLGKRKVEQSNVEALKQEEAEGLRKFYREIVTPEILDQNFSRWQKHLTERLKEKYPNIATREAAILKAKEYTDTLPVHHGSIYEHLRRSSLPYISSFFIAQGQVDTKGKVLGNTNNFDSLHELDHFVYGSVGVMEPDTKNEWDPAGWTAIVLIDNTVLEEKGTLVSLGDYAHDINTRLGEQKYKGNIGPDRWKEAFEIELQQIWRGSDFKILLPMMLAYSYDRPNDLEDLKPVPLGFVPSGLLPLTKGNSYYHPKTGKDEYDPDILRFQVRIPRPIVPKDILGFAVDESAIKRGEDLYSDSLIVVPSNLSSEDKRKFIRKKLSARLANHLSGVAEETPHY